MGEKGIFINKVELELKEKEQRILEINNQILIAEQAESRKDSCKFELEKIIEETKNSIEKINELKEVEVKTVQIVETQLLKDSINDLEEQNRKLVKENLEIRQNLEETKEILSKELEEKEKDFEEALIKMEAEIFNLETQNEKIFNFNEKMKNENKFLQEKTFKNYEYDRIVNENHILKDEKTSLEAEIIRTQRERNISLKTKEEFLKKENEVQETIKKYKNKIEELKKELFERNQASLFHKRNYIKFVEELGILKEKNTKLNNERIKETEALQNKININKQPEKKLSIYE